MARRSLFAPVAGFVPVAAFASGRPVTGLIGGGLSSGLAASAVTTAAPMANAMKPPASLDTDMRPTQPPPWREQRARGFLLVSRPGGAKGSCMRGVFPNLRQGATCDMAQTRDLAPPGKRPAFVECRLSVVQLAGEPAPLLGEIEQNSRVLGGIGRFGQLLASRCVRTTFFRIAGHSANPCATLHTRKRQMVS